MNIPKSICFSRPETHTGWRAEIRLRYGVKRDKTRLLERHQLGPLTVQKTFFPEGAACHTYLLHPPGGVVGGDQLSFDIRVEADGHALLTTPGATKFYRSNGAEAWQGQKLVAKRGSLLEWLPMENIYFPGVNCKLLTHIELESDARFIGWEMQCFGRPMLGEGFDKGRVVGQTFISRDGKLLLAESLRVLAPDQSGTKAASMRDFAMSGSMYITPVDSILLEKITWIIEQQQLRFGAAVLLGASEISRSSGNSSSTFCASDSDQTSLLVVRALGDQTEPMMACFVKIWQAVREYWLGKRPETPRIWST